MGVAFGWYELARKESEQGDLGNVRGVEMGVLFGCAAFVFFLYRFISAYFVWEFTGKWRRSFVQFLDLEIYRAIYIAHTLGRDEAGNLQRWLQKFEVAIHIGRF